MTNNKSLTIQKLIFLRIIILEITILFFISFPLSVSAQEFTEELIQKTKKAVVSIKIKSSHSAYDYIGEVFGTGFVIDKIRGIILTNKHIIMPATIASFEVTFFDGREINAKLLYYDPWQDFAFLQIAPELIPEEAMALQLKAISPILNQNVLMVGNNQGQEFSIQTGNISSIYESAGPFPSQSLRISLNSMGGSSGSPILDKNGNVIAINHSGTQTSAIALPMNYVIDALNSVNNKLDPSRKHFGAIIKFYSLDHAVKYADFSKENMVTYINKYPNSFNRTLMIEFIMNNSPAYGKLKAGDIIWSINEVEIGPNLYLLEKIMNDSISNTVKLKIFRLGKFLDIDVPLYNLQSKKIKKIIEFGGATFYEADDYISILTGASTKNVFVSAFSNSKCNTLIIL
jgi:S1-C subfamily serine protease